MESQSTDTADPWPGYSPAARDQKAEAGEAEGRNGAFKQSCTQRTAPYAHIPRTEKAEEGQEAEAKQTKAKSAKEKDEQETKDK